MKINSQQSETYGTQQRQSWEGIRTDTGLPIKDRNISNKQPNHTPTRTGGMTTKSRASRRKEITKIRAELNDIDTKSQFKRSINPGTCSLKR